MSTKVAHTCDAGCLTFSSGLTIFLHRKLDPLQPGEMLEVRLSDRSSVHDIRAWIRLAGHQLVSLSEDQSQVCCLIQRGTAQRLIVDSATDWGNRPPVLDGRLDTRALVIGAAAKIPAHADPSSGFSPRGSVVEKGSPTYPFDVLDADPAWAPASSELYDQASAGHWNGSTDIPWNQLQKLDSELERAVCQMMTFLAENEFSALYVPAKWIARIHPHFVETVLFLSTQVRDEARHIEVFVKRALANGGGLQFSSASTQQSLKSLLDREDFLEATFLLSVLGEGTFLDLLRFVEAHGPDSVTREIARRTRVDESRHVHFALSHIQHAIQADGAVKRKLSRAVLDRASVLSDIRTLNPLVEESLVILAAGGLTPAALPHGMNEVRELHSTMHENRIKRLQLVGFDHSEAGELSTLHTANFM
jgi:TusA-related sulfurtransferase